jgi:hypothetical protein
VHRDATDVAVALLDLAGVQSCPDLQGDTGELVSEGSRVVLRASRSSRSSEPNSAAAGAAATA